MDNSTLSLYHTFAVAAQTGSLTAASKELFISQPAISKSIKKLEQMLNTTLFFRNSRGVSLTTEGKTLYEYVQKAFETINLGENNLKHINSLGIGHLTIGVSSTLCKHILLPLLKTFVETHPHIQIAIECQSTLHTIKLLENGEIDFGLIAQPENTKLLECIPLKELNDIFVATPQYLNHLAKRAQITSDETLFHADLILLDRQNMSRQYVEQYLNAWNINTENAMEINSMELLIDFTKTGLGTGCIIKEFIQTELNEKKLIQIKTPEEIKSRKVCFAYKKIPRLSTAGEAFLKHIQNK